MPRGIETRDLAVSPFRLGEWLVDPNLGHLTRGATTVHVELRVMDVLVFLAIHASKLVTRKQLIDSVWGTEFISENTLTHAIAELRSALGDDAKSPSYIETIHRRGYRLLVGAFEPDETQTAAANKPSCFYVVRGDRSVQLAQGENLIGRIPWATVTVDALQVSRRHAHIIVEGFTALLEDLGSKNGTSLNGRLLDGPAALADGDRIGLGSHVVLLQLDATLTTEEGDTPTDPAFES